MPQFDIYRERGGSLLLLDCQSDLFDHFDTRLVIPLMPVDAAEPLTRLHPIFKFDGHDVMLSTQLASSVGVSELTDHVGSLAHERYTILNAIDMLVSGF
jgi:toxin CcdB